jgi:DNA anti-recombination protein RmuC
MDGYSDLSRETLAQMLRQRDAQLEHEIEEFNAIAKKLHKQTRALHAALQLISFLMKETRNG